VVFAQTRTERDSADASAEATIAFTSGMLCKPTFRPRSVIARLMYPTFWALWNEVAVQVGVDEPSAVEILVDDMDTQIDFYDQHGVAALRGGRAHLVAAQIGADRRMKAEIAESANLTLEEFDALSEDERNAIVDEVTMRNLQAMRDAGELES